jgi:hypothetical protein
MNPVCVESELIGGVKTAVLAHLQSDCVLRAATREVFMRAIQDGQCGLCNHFGEHHHQAAVRATILSSKSAEPTLLYECSHLKHAALHLKVTPFSGCDGFVAAAQV